MDGCSTNECFSNMVHADQYIEWMMNRCFSHCGNIADDEVGSLMLDQFWTLLQKIFVQSENARIIFEDVTDVAWKSFLDKCWWSKFIVFHMLLNFGYVMELIFKTLEKHESPENSTKLLKMLQYPISLFYIEIKFASYTEGLKKIGEFTYDAESDGQLVVSFGKNIDDMIAFYPSQGFCNLISADRIIDETSIIPCI
jgi:hypothetical protein